MKTRMRIVETTIRQFYVQPTLSEDFDEVHLYNIYGKSL